MKPFASGLMWFRRDLRADDNAALAQASHSCGKLHAAFVFDTAILDALPRADRRVEFIRDSLHALDEDLRQRTGRAESGLIVLHGNAQEEIPKLAARLGVQAVFANHDYEPQAMARDAMVLGALASAGIAFHTFKDQVVFERREVLTQGATPYAVFTPYKKAWLSKLGPHDVEAHAFDAGTLAERPEGFRRAVPSLKDIGFESTNLHELKIPTGTAGARELLEDFLARIDHYGGARDYPALKGPSYLSVHLRFGTVSIRELVRDASARAAAGSAGASTWLGELIWRDFYFQVLANFHVVDEKGASHSFHRSYDRIAWEKGKLARERFAAWCEARTGYPIVDAAMLQLVRTGYMHNRLRMVTASFLTKDLGVDWRWGERFFAEHLNDFDLAANNGGWQWAASSGCDAQPWFRIFNPVSQSRRFDAEGKFILRYLPQLEGLPTAALHAPWTASPIELAGAGIELGRNYPLPIVDHEKARQLTLARYSVVKSPGR